MNTAQVNEWLTRAEVAAWLRCSDQTVDNLRKDGAFVTRRVGRKVLISHNSIRQFVDSQAQ